MTAPNKATAASAQSKLSLQVVGNLGITTQYKELEEPFWSKRISAATGGRITATIKPWNEMGLKGPEVEQLYADGRAWLGGAPLSR